MLWHFIDMNDNIIAIQYKIYNIILNMILNIITWIIKYKYQGKRNLKIIFLYKYCNNIYV